MSRRVDGAQWVADNSLKFRVNGVFVNGKMTVSLPDATINLSNVEQFCAVAGNKGESFKVVRNDNVQAPMDFAIVTCWKVIPILSLHTLFLSFIRPS